VQSYTTQLFQSRKRGAKLLVELFTQPVNLFSLVLDYLQEYNFTSHTLTNYYAHVHVLSYPAYTNMNYSNALGFLLLITLAIQIFSGLLLIVYYLCSFSLAWASICLLIIEANFGMLIRTTHVAGAFVYMLLLLLH
jgi:quinol-cytochrome oxidoreductase complex cytochrome b subunit